MRLLAAALVAALVGMLLAGCGYSSSSLVPTEYKTIGVPVFANATRRHDLEWEVTQAVVEELQSRTHLLVVAPGDAPDLMLKGALVDVDEDVLSRRKRQRIRESAVFLTAEIEITDTRSGSAIVAKTTVTERESFVPDKGENIRTARGEAVRMLAERIVRQLEGGW